MTPANLTDLTGQVVLVTGGNTGIGLGMADALAGAGADVAIWGRTADRNQQAAERLLSHGSRVVTITCDIASEEEVEEAFAATIDQLGQVDACFANAAYVTPFVPFVDQDADQWRTTFDVNVLGTFYTLRAASRHLLDRGHGGNLIAVASTAATYGVAKGQPYAASKAAVIAMVNGLAVELGRDGIRVNAILPCFVETRATQFLSTQPYVKRVLPRIPLRRWGTPEDLGGLAIYLASPMSAYQTGGSFVVDGGYSRF